jgi:Ribosomal protein L32
MSVLVAFPIIFIFLLIYLGQALWIYTDGRKRGIEYAWIWALLALVSFPVPLIIYIIISRTDKRRCMNCGRLADRALKICPYCGERPSEVCHNCGYPIEKEWNYCPNCNEKIK